MQSKCEKRSEGNIAQGGRGLEKKADAAKEIKRIFKGRDEVGKPRRAGAAGAIAFLGINVTVLLLEKGRHK